MIRIRIAAVLCPLIIASGILTAGIRPNEALAITISGVPEVDRADFNATYPVSGDGMINLPLLEDDSVIVPQKRPFEGGW